MYVAKVTCFLQDLDSPHVICSSELFNASSFIQLGLKFELNKYIIDVQQTQDLGTVEEGY